ncbi:hypothetical protein [Clostridium algidicarnis]|uniref:Uncharacterized protein n=1 Tax=Clostridium algidicarnis DSM 15099 TaxID=1121295 RepID=A0A2S6G0B3_9CLOT|nr:hypothetical protein [Clostridium algidicarnis]PPK49302.1 hypothetical protein BD821_102221 [Clostridium algidicarnis DSM 15099]
MNINIKVEPNNKQIIVESSNKCSIKNEIYKLGESINLTDLVKYISDINNYIEINPESFGVFKNESKCEDKEILKITEYIYKVFDAYNKSYQEVCVDKET